MKRCILLLGLLGLVGCEEPVPPPPTPEPGTQACPGTDDDPTQLQAPTAALADREEAVLVRFKPRSGVGQLRAADLFAQAVERVGGSVQHRFESLHALAAHLTPEERRALEAHPDVLSVDPDREVRAFGLPLSGHLSLMGAASTGEYTDGIKMVQAPRIWDANSDGVLDTGAPSGQGSGQNDFKVCVIDSGIDPRHPELQAAVVGGYDFVENDNDPSDYHTTRKLWGGGHGTHVAGTIAARLGSGGGVAPGADSNGVAGVAPGARLLIARVLDVEGKGSTSNVIRALRWCQQQGARLASLSLGSSNSDETERAAFQEALAGNMLSIAASGNSGTDEPTTSPDISFPARYPEVMAVGAVSFDEKRALFSQYGPALSLVAPGMGVLSASILGSSSFSVVKADGSEFSSRALEFAGVGDYSGPIVDCGIGNSKTSCGQNQCGGFVAYVDRGVATFADKVKNVRQQGARAVIVGNNKPEEAGEGFTLGVAGRWMPVAIVPQSAGASIKAMAGRTAHVKLVGIDYAREQGTSMATPHVTGVAALVLSAKPGLTPAQLRDALEKSAKNLGGDSGRDNQFGFGLVQACPAIERATGTRPTGCPAP